MPSVSRMPMTPRDAGRPRGFWLGGGGGPEFTFVRDALHDRLDLVEHVSVAAASAWEEAGPARQPALVILASDRPGRWSLAATGEIVGRWPLAALFGVATSLGEGRRRAGLAVPGIEEIAWHDLPGRLECWLDDLAAGRAGSLGIPMPARREERLLDAIEAICRARRPPAGQAVSIAGARGADLEGLRDLLTLMGRRVASVTTERPSLDTAAPLLVWDAVAITADDLAWLRMLAANRPSLGIVVLESFPRGDVVQAAVRAGAGAVLGRPLVLDALEGALRTLERRAGENRGPNGLGASAGHR